MAMAVSTHVWGHQDPFGPKLVEGYFFWSSVRMPFWSYMPHCGDRSFAPDTDDFPMRLELKPHPNALCDAVQRIEVNVSRPAPGILLLEYIVTGAIAGLLLPPVTPPARADNLWRHTCFEAFLRKGGGKSYHEFNFAPSGQWAAYEFDDYRAGMRDADIDPPVIETRTDASSFQLRALFALPSGDSWHLALCAVIEAKSGGKSYWALVHPPGKADFHHPNSFVHELS